MPVAVPPKILSAEDLLAKAAKLTVRDMKFEGAYSAVLTMSDGEKYRLFPVDDNWVSLAGEEISEYAQFFAGSFSFFKITFRSGKVAAFRTQEVK